MWIEDEPEFEWNTAIISKFDGRNMDEEKKLEEIKRRVEALLAAYKLARPTPEYRKEYLEIPKGPAGEIRVKEKSDVEVNPFNNNSSFWALI